MEAPSSREGASYLLWSMDLKFWCRLDMQRSQFVAERCLKAVDFSPRDLHRQDTRRGATAENLRRTHTSSVAPRRIRLRPPNRGLKSTATLIELLRDELTPKASETFR